MKKLTLTVLAAALLASACAQATPVTDNQQFMRILREQSAARQSQAVSPLPAPAGRVSVQDERWMRDVQQRLASRVAPDAKPQPRALYFVSFSIPEDGLKLMLPEAEKWAIPPLINGLIDNDFRKTVAAIFRLVRDNPQGGVQIDPRQFTRYGIKAVPALVVVCGDKHDTITGNIRLKTALERVASEGDCADVAREMLQEAQP